MASRIPNFQANNGTSPRYGGGGGGRNNSRTTNNSRGGNGRRDSRPDRNDRGGRGGRNGYDRNRGGRRGGNAYRQQRNNNSRTGNRGQRGGQGNRGPPRINYAQQPGQTINTQARQGDEYNRQQLVISQQNNQVPRTLLNIRRLGAATAYVRELIGTASARMYQSYTRKKIPGSFTGNRNGMPFPLTEIHEFNLKPQAYVAPTRQHSDSVAAVTETPPTIAKHPFIAQDVTDKPAGLTDNHGFKAVDIDTNPLYEGLHRAYSEELGHLPGKWSPDDLAKQHKGASEKLRDSDKELKDVVQEISELKVFGEATYNKHQLKKSNEETRATNILRHAEAVQARNVEIEEWQERTDALPAVQQEYNARLLEYNMRLAMREWHQLRIANAAAAPPADWVTIRDGNAGHMIGNVDIAAWEPQQGPAGLAQIGDELPEPQQPAGLGPEPQPLNDLSAAQERVGFLSARTAPEYYFEKLSALNSRVRDLKIVKEELLALTLSKKREVDNCLKFYTCDQEFAATISRIIQQDQTTKLIMTAEKKQKLFNLYKKISDGLPWATSLNGLYEFGDGITSESIRYKSGTVLLTALERILERSNQWSDAYDYIDAELKSADFANYNVVSVWHIPHSKFDGMTPSLENIYAQVQKDNKIAQALFEQKYSVEERQHHRRITDEALFYAIMKNLCEKAIADPSIFPAWNLLAEKFTQFFMVDWNRHATPQLIIETFDNQSQINASVFQVQREKANELGWSRDNAQQINFTNAGTSTNFSSNLSDQLLPGQKWPPSDNNSTLEVKVMRLVGKSAEGHCNGCHVPGFVHRHDKDLARVNEDGTPKRVNDDPQGEIKMGRRCCPAAAWAKVSAQNAKAKGYDPRGKKSSDNRGRRNDRRGGGDRDRGNGPDRGGRGGRRDENRGGDQQVTDIDVYVNVCFENGRQWMDAWVTAPCTACSSISWVNGGPPFLPCIIDARYSEPTGGHSNHKEDWQLINAVCTNLHFEGVGVPGRMNQVRLWSQTGLEVTLAMQSRTRQYPPQIRNQNPVAQRIFAHLHQDLHREMQAAQAQLRARSSRAAPPASAPAAGFPSLTDGSPALLPPPPTPTTLYGAPSPNDGGGGGDSGTRMFHMAPAHPLGPPATPLDYSKLTKPAGPSHAYHNSIYKVQQDQGGEMTKDELSIFTHQDDITSRVKVYNAELDQLIEAESRGLAGRNSAQIKASFMEVIQGHNFTAHYNQYLTRFESYVEEHSGSKPRFGSILKQRHTMLTEQYEQLRMTLINEGMVAT